MKQNLLTFEWMAKFQHTKSSGVFFFPFSVFLSRKLSHIYISFIEGINFFINYPLIILPLPFPRNTQGSLSSISYIAMYITTEISKHAPLLSSHKQGATLPTPHPPLLLLCERNFFFLVEVGIQMSLNTLRHPLSIPNVHTINEWCDKIERSLCLHPFACMYTVSGPC